MVWRTWRGLVGGGVAALLLLVPAATPQAQTAGPSIHAPSAPAPVHTETPAKTPAKPATVKTAAKKREPAHPAKRVVAAAKPVVAAAKPVVAAAKPTPAGKKLAAALKPPPRKFAAAKQRAEPTRVASAAPRPAPPGPATARPAAPSSRLPSYTVTSTRGNVIYTSTRIVPFAAAAQPHPATLAPTLAAAPAAATPAAAAASRSAAPTQIGALPPSTTRPVAPTPTPPAAATTAATAPATAAAAPDKPAAPPAEGSAARPPEPIGPALFVADFLKAAFRIAKSEATSLQRRAQLADLFARKMDVRKIAGYTTADELTGMSPEMQERFRTILVSYLVETYYPQLELASDPSVTVETTPAPALADGTAVVWTTFTKGGWGSESIQWHLAAEDGGLKIVDIFSAGASLVQMERDTFLSVMRDGGVSELMTKLDQRTRQLANAATE